jgi:hypothetical protein
MKENKRKREITQTPDSSLVNRCIARLRRDDAVSRSLGDNWRSCLLLRVSRFRRRGKSLYW